MQNLNSEVRSAAIINGVIQLTWTLGQVSALGTYWLRDNCPCSLCRHPGNGQKLYEIVDLPRELSPREAFLAENQTLKVVWSDGHRSAYTQDWLIAHNLCEQARAARRPQVQLWRGEIAGNLPVGDWPAVVTDPVAEMAWLERFSVLGFGLLKNVPTEPGTVADVGDRLGFVRVTNYGRLFDVKSVPNPTNLAYTAVGLGVHSDNPYRHPSPGVQLLHCLESEAPGGDTLLVDGFAAAEILRQEDTVAFELLTTVPMTFHYADAQTDLYAQQTLISVDHVGAVTGVHFNNRSADWLDAPAEVTEDWYAAYIQFGRILKRPELELVFRLEPGQCLVMRRDGKPPCRAAPLHYPAEPPVVPSGAVRASTRHVGRCLSSHARD
jgi:gamma-butyrobetaine dioxygenase